VEIPGRFANIGFPNFRQLLYDAIDSDIGEVLSVAKAFRNKNPDQARADYLVLLAGYLGVSVKPGQ
jgi:hypothetical protein